MAGEWPNNLPKVTFVGLLITMPATIGGSEGGSISITVRWKSGSGRSGLATRKKGLRSCCCDSRAVIGTASKAAHVSRTTASKRSTTRRADGRVRRRSAIANAEDVLIPPSDESMVDLFQEFASAAV